MTQDVGLLIKMWFGGLVLACLVSVPDWPIYNRHNIRWLSELPTNANAKPKFKSNIPERPTPSFWQMVLFGNGSA